MAAPRERHLVSRPGGASNVTVKMKLTRPTQMAREDILERLLDTLNSWNWPERGRACEQLGQLGDKRAVEPLIRQLRAREWVAQKAACAALGQLGDLRAVDPLVEFFLKRDWSGMQIPTSHAKTSLAALYAKHGEHADAWLCPEHLIWFEERSLDAHGLTANIFACRQCGQTSRVVPASKVIAVLDSTRETKITWTASVARVNWLRHGSLFDFDQVEIIMAKNREVMQFCIDVRNDTDAFRQPRYQEIECVIAPECELDEITYRNLRQIFGSVSIALIPVQ